MRTPEWEPIPQRKPTRGAQDELRIEVPPDEPAPSKDKQKPKYEIGEDITPADYTGDVEEEEI